MTSVPVRADREVLVDVLRLAPRQPVHHLAEGSAVLVLRHKLSDGAIFVSRQLVLYHPHRSRQRDEHRGVVVAVLHQDEQRLRDEVVLAQVPVSQGQQKAELCPLLVVEVPGEIEVPSVGVPPHHRH